MTWQRDKNNTGFTDEECNSDETNLDQKVTDGNRASQTSRQHGKSLRCNNLNKLVLPHLNINSIRNEFKLLSEQVRGNVDVLMVYETKIDDSFPIGNFFNSWF